MFDEYYRRTWSDDGSISEHQSELATSLRVPLLTSQNPRWNYITGIVVCDEQYGDHGIVPSDDEIRLLGAHLAEYNRYYRQEFVDAMKHFAPYDIDGGANLGYYMKRPSGGWCYRKRTWYSHHWWPQNWPDPAPVLPLSHVLVRNFTGWSGLRAGYAR